MAGGPAPLATALARAGAFASESGPAARWHET